MSVEETKTIKKALVCCVVETTLATNDKGEVFFLIRDAQNKDTMLGMNAEQLFEWLKSNEQIWRRKKETYVV